MPQPSPLNLRSYMRGEQDVWRAVVWVWLVGTITASAIYYQLERILAGGEWDSYFPILRWMIVTLVAAWRGVAIVARCGENSVSTKIGSTLFAISAMVTGIATLFALLVVSFFL